MRAGRAGDDGPLGEHYGNTVPVDRLQLADLRLWHVIVANCPVCRHHQRLSVIELCRGQSEQLPLIQLQPNLRCTHCGNHAGNRLLVALLPRN